ncbi:MAG: hypothetical protein ACRD43_14690, partial [Pyrinomonadaceae bacterium]
MKNKIEKGPIRIRAAIFATALATAVLSTFFVISFSARAAGPKTWDGGGLTNNWSDAANWSDDIIPTSGDDVIFDGTSTKDATIDVDITVSSINIGGGYAGTITQSNSASIQISGCSGKPCFQQSNGTFNGGSST